MPINNNVFQFINANDLFNHPPPNWDPIQWQEDGGAKKKKAPIKPQHDPLYFDYLDEYHKKVILIKHLTCKYDRLNVKSEKGYVMNGFTASPVADEDAVYYQHTYLDKTDKLNTVIDVITGEYAYKPHCRKIITDLKTLTADFTLCFDFLPRAYHKELGDIIVISRDVLLKAGYEECIMNGIFYNDGKNKMRCKEDNRGNYVKYRNPIRNTLVHCTRDMSIRYGEESNTFLLTEGKKYTFGCELEFSDLYVPNYIKLDYNMECVRDGSLNKDIPGNVGGPEIVTGVLTGDSGINHLQDICLELSPRCKIDKYCGVHVHIGNFTRNNEFILFAYMLGQKIQKEFLNIVPPSRRDNAYCKLLKPFPFSFSRLSSPVEIKMMMDRYFNALFQYLSCGQPLGKVLNTKSQHPMGPKTQYDHSTPRYCWLNLIPTAFNTREDGSYTIEFRHMQGSCNFDKILNWIKICMAFVYYVENAQDSIMFDPVIKLEDIVRFAYPKSYKQLVQYINERKSKFNTDDTAEEREYMEKTTTKKKIKEIICV